MKQQQFEEDFPHLPSSPIVESVIQWSARSSFGSHEQTWQDSFKERLKEFPTSFPIHSTTELTEMAIARGFRGIDTANQRKHYDEAAVGRAIATAMASGSFVRDELFLQTKYTFQRGQDHRLPYNPTSSIATQVEESFASSLQHLGVDRIDSYLLHGPSRATGLGAEDWEAWRAMEKIHASGSPMHNDG